MLSLGVIEGTLVLTQPCHKYANLNMFIYRLPGDVLRYISDAGSGGEATTEPDGWEESPVEETIDACSSITSSYEASLLFFNSLPRDHQSRIVASYLSSGNPDQLSRPTDILKLVAGNRLCSS